jgi:isochorismate synthase
LVDARKQHPEILIAQNNELVYPAQFNKLNGKEGFVFAPYEISEKSPLVLLRPGIYKKGLKEILDIDCQNIQKEIAEKQESESPYFISKRIFERHQKNSR